MCSGDLISRSSVYRTRNDLSWLIVRVSYPDRLSVDPIVKTIYRIFRLLCIISWKPFIGFCVYRVSYRENRLSEFAFIVYRENCLSGFAFIVLIEMQ